MPKKQRPRFGSMGVRPRKRATRQTARIRTQPSRDEAGPVGIAAYKVGMTHVLAKGFNKQPKNKNVRSQIPVTVLECPPLRIASLRTYVYDDEHLVADKQFTFKTNTELRRHTPQPKDNVATAEDLEDIDPSSVEDIRVQVYTQPSKAELKKKPELFELGLGGSNEDKLSFVKEHIDQPIPISKVFSEGDYADITAITKGKGNQGPVKRFGIGLKGHKSQKGRRRPGSLGPWVRHQHIMHRVPQAGQDGYHQRTQFNNLIMKIGDEPQNINVEGGFKHYGEVKNEYILIKGSVPGPAKRLITLTHPTRPTKKTGYDSSQITYISTTSKQG